MNKLAMFLAGYLILPSVVEAQSLMLDSFNSGSATGSTLGGTSWVGNITQNATTITVGGTAKNDNGWGATGLSINASAMNYLVISGQRDSGHDATTAFVIQLEDTNLNTQVFSVSTASFGVGTLTQVQVPLVSWTGGFDATRISGWTIGGGNPPPGNQAFRMTLDSLSFATSNSGASLGPTITTQPTSATVVVGQTANLSVVATGNPTPSFQWRKNGTAITGATSATLTFASSAATDAGTYTVVVSNSVSSVTSTAATLTVNTLPAATTLPTITTQPTANPSYLVGATVSLSVAATGLPAPTFQWRKNGVAITGATGAGLTISGLALADAGTYSVVVGNSAGSVTSSNLTFAVYRAPAIATHPAGQTVAMGGSANFNVIATGDPAPTYQWQRNGANIVGATGATLLIASVTSTDVASYTVVVTNAGGNAISNAATLAAATTLAITTHPANTTVNQGRSATLTVVATGIPAPTFQWKKDAVAIAGATSTTLNIASTTATDAGIYSVVVSNSTGAVTSLPAALTINSVPTITAQPASVATGPGQTASLTVTATGSPAPSFQWFKSGVPLTGATKATLTVANSAASDAGNYTVVVSNSVGSVTSNSATVTFRANTYSGIYFGILSGGQGNWTLFVRPDNTGIFIAYLIPSKAAFVCNVAVDVDGSLSVTASTVAFGARSIAMNRGPSMAAEATAAVLIGQIGTSGQVAGNIGWGGFIAGVSGALDAPVGPPSALAGLYTAPALNTTNGAAYTVVGPSGKTFVLTTTTTGTDSAIGSINSNGQLSAVTANGVQLQLNVNAASQTLGVILSTAGGGGTTNFSGLADTVVSTSRLVNLSVRTAAGVGAQTLIVGFVIGGTGGTRTVPVLIRATGPALATFGVSGVLEDPVLTLLQGSTVLSSNDNWGTNATEVTSVGGAVGAFPLVNSGSKDSALYNSGIQPGAYTAQITGSAGTTGIALAEIYDALSGSTTGSPRLINVSARSQVDTGGGILIAGIVITGNAPKKMLIRGIGPTLSLFSVTGVLADPKLELHTMIDGRDTVTGANDDWGGVPLLNAAFAAVGAFPLNSASKDAAILVTLLPGNYTAQVLGAGGGTGVALIEVYELP